MKKVIGILFGIILTAMALATGFLLTDTDTSAAKAPSIQVEKTDFATGETIRVTLVSFATEDVITTSGQDLPEQEFNGN